MRYQQIVEFNDSEMHTVGYIPMDEAEPQEDGAHHWRSADWLRLRPLMLAFLTEMYLEERGDIVPTNENADILIKTGLLRAAEGDPCLALWKNGVIIGFTFWVGTGQIHPALEIREKSCSGLGTFIMEQYRRQGHSTALRNAAFEAAKKAGYVRVDGAAYDKVGVESMKKLGAKTTSLVISRRL